MKRSRKFYDRNEKYVMQLLGFKPTKASGAGWVEKEDGESEYAIAQLKSTDAESYSLKLLDLHKLENNAYVSNKIPVFVLQFLKTNDIYAVVNINDMQDLDKLVEQGYVDIVNVAVQPQKQKATKMIKSKAANRNKFFKERKKQWQKKITK